MKFSTKTKTLSYSFEFTHGIRRALVSALILVYLLSLGFNVIAITTLFAVSTLIMTFFEFPTGAIADYDSRKKSLLISFLLMFVSFLGIFLFRSFWTIAGFWILNDIAWTFSTGAGSAWVIDALDYSKKKSKIINFISRGYLFEKVGQVIGGLIGLVVVAINFRFVWLIISLSYLVLFFIGLKFIEERNFKPEKIPHNYVRKSLIKAKESFDYLIHKNNKQLRILMLGNFLGTIAIGIFFVGMPLFFTQTLGLNPEYLSGIIAFVAGVTIISPLIAEKIANTNGIKNSMVLSVSIMTISIFIFALSDSLIFAVISFTVLQLSGIILDVIGESAEHHEFDSKIRASLGSVSSIIWSVGFAISVFLAGLSINFFGVVNTLLISGGTSLLEVFVYFGLLRNDKNEI
jgi:MFS family permease